MKQSDTVKIASEWEQNISTNVSYSCFNQVADMNILQLTFFVDYREPSQATNSWLSLITGTVDWPGSFRHATYRRLISPISF